jgi:hypothetical protein
VRIDMVEHSFTSCLFLVAMTVDVLCRRGIFSKMAICTAENITGN